MEKLKIKKWKDETRNDGVSGIIFKRGNVLFEISFQGNLDLYFRIQSSKKTPPFEFIIGKDNYKTYEIFDLLYKEVTNGITYFELTKSEIDKIVSNAEFFGEDYHEKLKKRELYIKTTKENVLKVSSRTGLIKGSSIIWKSDEYYEEVAPFFKIDKLENAYKITFDMPKITRELEIEERILYFNKNYISVRLRNNGSRYEMYNIPFMKMFNKLMTLDLEDQQIYLEEYIIEEMQKSRELEEILTKTKKIGR